MAACHGMPEFGDRNTGSHSYAEIYDPKTDDKRDEDPGPTPEAASAEYAHVEEQNREFHQHSRHSPADHSGHNVLAVSDIDAIGG